MKGSLKCLLFLCVMTPGVILHAASVTIGNFNGGNCLPLMCNSSGSAVGQSIDYEQVFSAAAFSGPMTINLIGWFYDSAAGGESTLLGGLYTVSWGYAALGSVNHLSTNLASNYTLGPTQIASISVPSGGINDNPGINLTLDAAQQFTYNPALGNLLLEIVASNQDNVPNGSGNGYNEADLSGSVTSRAYCIGGRGCSADSTGLVTIFSGPTAIPEPGTFGMMVVSGIAALAGGLRRRRLVELWSRQKRPKTAG